MAIFSIPLSLRHLPPTPMAAWRSGSVDGRIDEAALRRTRLVLGWVTVSGREHYVGM